MGIISAVVLAVSPFIVKKATDIFKGILSVEKTGGRVAVIRLFVAIGSLVLAVANSWLVGGDVDSSLIQNTIDSVVFAIVTYFGASGAYLLKKDTPDE